MPIENIPVGLVGQTVPGSTQVSFRTLEGGIGNVFYVDSGSGSDNNGGTMPTYALATLDAAIGKCTANNGDTIYVLAGHSETITASNTLTADVAGIRIVGLGYGSDRPTFLIDGSTTAEVGVSAANVRWENCIFKAGHADVTNAFDVSATGFTIIGCEFVDNTTNENFVDFLNVSSTTNNAADKLTVLDCDFWSNDANVAGVVQTAGDLDRLRIQNCRITLGNTDESLVGVATGKDITNCLITNNLVDRRSYTQGSLICDADTTDQNTGLIAYNAIGHSDTATEVLAPATSGFRYVENYATAVVDKSGYILPAVDS